MATREVRVDLTGTREYRDLLAKLAATKRVLAERERELREIRGCCSWMACRLHLAHSGPCDMPDEVPQ